MKMKLSDLNKKLIELEIAFPGFPVQQVIFLQQLQIILLYLSLFRLWEFWKKISKMATDSATIYLYFY